MPDWPLSYGQLMPPMEGGVFYEHGHRMVASAVGLLMVILAVWVFMRERRRWVGWLAAAALAAVVVQGVLGGITVLLLLPPAVSIAHACLAQIFFCLTITLATVTSPGWTERAAREERSPAPLASASIVLAAAVFLQLALGATMRHLAAGLAIPDFPLSFGLIVPPLDSIPVTINFAHRFWGVVVAVLALRMAARVAARHAGERWLTRPAWILAALVPAQVLLGAFTVWSSRGLIPTTAHVAFGAAILGTSVALSLRIHRLAWLARHDACERGPAATARAGQGLTPRENPA